MFKRFLVFIFIILFIKISLAQDITSVWESFLREDYQRVIRNIEEIKISSDKRKLEAEIYYLLGISYLKLGDVEKGRENLKYLLDIYPHSEWADSAKIALGDCFLLERNLAKAEESYKSFIEKNKKSPLLSLAYFKLAEVKRKQGDWNEAKELYEKIVSISPNSLEAKFSQEIISKGEFFFTFQVGSFINRENAQRLVEELNEKGFSAYINEYIKLGKIFYRVRVGKFLNKDDYEETRKRLVDLGYTPILYP